MTKSRSISPTPHSKFSQWVDDIIENRENVDVVLDEVYREGFLAGADAELEACVEWLAQNCGRWELSSALRAARRPKSPRLAEEALKALQDQIDTSFKISSEAQERANTIRAALNRLKELEDGNE